MGEQPAALRLSYSSPTSHLGKVKKENGPLFREEAPQGFHSVQGCKGQALIHNEFIVYKTAQCTLRYIAEIQQA